MAATYALQQLVISIVETGAASLNANTTIENLPTGFLVYLGQAFNLHEFLFVINTDWYLRPWTLVTSTLAHSPSGITHLLFNGIFLFFIGPTIERVLGVKRFVILFLVGGALAGVAQVHLSHALQGSSYGALGASGAIMAVFGVMIILFPNEKILLWGIVPIPMWIAGIGYAALDIMGALGGSSGIGNFAHLAGMALGLAYGMNLKQGMRGNAWVRG